jgi:formylglycine-generating enzyme required for sulfatase activity
VLRGGSWFNSGEGNYRGAYRGDDDPDGWNYYVGFRCVALSPGP